MRRWLSWTHANRLDEMRQNGIDIKDSTQHYWIRTIPNDKNTMPWIEAAVSHLGVRIVWIDNWSQVGLALNKMLGISKKNPPPTRTKKGKDTFRKRPNKKVRKVFNDILGFRAFCDSYDDILTGNKSEFHIADLSHGKANDDGYRGVHAYFQLSGRHYPIEIQFNTLYDRQINNWLHDYLYKKDYPISIGYIMRQKYENGLIKSTTEFEEVLKDVLSGCER